MADVAHLLAELLENALAFSPPETTVQVATRMTPRGYIFVVSDNGVGMSADKLAESNQRIAMAASKEETPSKFLGLFVVGRLAARRGISVELFESPSGGVTARVTLPASALHVDRADAHIRADEAAAGDVPVDVPPVPALRAGSALDLPCASTCRRDHRRRPAPGHRRPAHGGPPICLVPIDRFRCSSLRRSRMRRSPRPTARRFASRPRESRRRRSGPPRTPNRPNRFGAAGRRPGAHLPRTVVEQPPRALPATTMAITTSTSSRLTSQRCRRPSSTAWPASNQAPPRPTNEKTEEIAGTS